MMDLFTNFISSLNPLAAPATRPWLNPDTGLPAGGFAQATGVANPYVQQPQQQGTLGDVLSQAARAQQAQAPQAPAQIPMLGAKIGGANKKAGVTPSATPINSRIQRPFAGLLGGYL